MNIAILHYHLNRGGVTQVIINHLRGLQAAARDTRTIRVALIHGGRMQGWPDSLSQELPNIELSFHGIPSLDYDSGKPNAGSLADRIEAAVSGVGFGAEDTIFHIHNHSIGKNVSLPGAICQLAERGHCLLLQIHDFAEDYRPSNYQRLIEALAPDSPGQLPNVLYPQAPSIHYSVLNGRDWNVLAKSGIAADRLHRLPNSVSEFDKMPSGELARQRFERQFGLARHQRLLLYPVRGIRRKNLGEALLWAAVGNGALSGAITLPPLNPVEKPMYETWRNLVQQLDLPFLFDVGASGGLGFGENLRAADAILTTSVAEGFGMVFLETWLAGRSLVGRDLPEITADYQEKGIRFESLSPRFAVPIDWIGREFYEEMSFAYANALSAYRQPIPDKARLNVEIDKLVVGGTVDFAQLGSQSQAIVIRRTEQSRASRDTLLDANPHVENVIASKFPSSEGIIQRNAEIVRAEYSNEKTGHRLLDIYSRVLGGKRGRNVLPPDNAPEVLRSFLGISRLQPIRMEP